MIPVGRAKLLGAVAALSLVAGVATLGTRTGDDGTYPVAAHFPRTIGLYPRSTVRVLGVEVGRVTSIVPQGDRVRVGMSIRDDIRIPTGARAIIVPISLISDRYVQLSPPWDGGPALEPGDEIPLERGVAPAELDDLLATLQELLQAIEPGTEAEPGALGQLVVNANEALGGRGRELGTTVDSLSTLLDVLGRRAGNLDSLIVGLDRVVGTLAARGDALAATNRGLNSVMSALSAEREALESGVGNLADLLGELGGLVRRHRSDLEEDLHTLQDATNAVVRQQEYVLRNILWLPVLTEGTVRAYDPVHRRIYVRDNQQARER